MQQSWARYLVCNLPLQIGAEGGHGGTTYAPNSLLSGGRNGWTTGFLLLATPRGQTQGMVKETQRLLPQK